jgi:hypothetical protein
VVITPTPTVLTPISIMSISSLDYVVYCACLRKPLYSWQYAGSARGPFLEEIVIAFMEKTWFLWWVFAIVVIVRWFHALPLDTQSEAPYEPRSTRDRDGLDAGEFSSHNASGLVA